MIKDSLHNAHSHKRQRDEKFLLKSVTEEINADVNQQQQQKKNPNFIWSRAALKPNRSQDSSSSLCIHYVWTFLASGMCGDTTVPFECYCVALTVAEL